VKGYQYVDLTLPKMNLETELGFIPYKHGYLLQNDKYAFFFDYGKRFKIYNKVTKQTENRTLPAKKSTSRSQLNDINRIQQLLKEYA